ncbi:MAG: flagellar biosynthetic protein FliR [Anaerovoracaceae bacterium]
MNTDIFAQLNLFAFILMRMSGMILVNPLLGRRNVPNYYKAGMVFAFSLLVYSCSPQTLPPSDSFPEYVLLLLKELVCGLAMGIVVNTFVYVISFAGEQMDMQMGLSMSAVYDPGSNISMSTSGTFYNIMFIVIFFSTNSHLTMIRLFLDSSQIVPYGEVVIHTQLTEIILDLFCQSTILGMKMALPVIFLELMLEIAVGTMMKAVPQIDIFVVNIQLKMLLGILLIFLTFEPMADFIEKVVETMFQGLQTVLSAMG